VNRSCHRIDYFPSIRDLPPAGIPAGRLWYPPAGTEGYGPHFPVAIRFSDRPRDPNRNQKSFRKNPGSVFFPKSIREIHIRIGSRFLDQNRSAVEKPVAGTFRSRSDRLRSVFCTKTGSRFADQNRSAIFIVRSGSGFYFSIAITIAIETYHPLVRIGRPSRFRKNIPVSRSGKGGGTARRSTARTCPDELL
jgi:hypothetical protein